MPRPPAILGLRATDRRAEGVDTGWAYGLDMFHLFYDYLAKIDWVVRPDLDFPGVELALDFFYETTRI